ncbi:DUF3303 domain-containing protein [Oricola cellulosilytica]|nr:DUF3303 family protein [Oricola cellulosilytica]
MKYAMVWRERRYGSAEAAESAQQRVLSLMQNWKEPEGVAFLQFVVRVGEYGGVALLETDDLSSIHQMTSTFAVFEFEVWPVLDVGDALAAEGAAVAWRESVS